MFNLSSPQFGMKQMPKPGISSKSFGATNMPKQNMPNKPGSGMGYKQNMPAQNMPNKIGSGSVKMMPLKSGM